MRVRSLSPRLAAAQSKWLVTEEPWRGLGYEAGPLGRWLGRKARAGQVRGAIERHAGDEADDDAVVGLIVVQPEVLLGRFVALLAVVPSAAGRGVGRALVEDALGRAMRGGVRWLYTSSDSSNRAAAAFYRRLGFVRVGRLPDLVRRGHIEILWRRPVG